MRKYYCTSCGEFVEVIEHLGDILCRNCHLVITSFEESENEM